MKEFCFPSKLTDIESPSDEFYWVENPDDHRQTSSGDLKDILDEVSSRLRQTGDCSAILTPEIFDHIYSFSKFVNYLTPSLVKEFVALEKTTALRFLHSLGEVSPNPRTRNTFKMLLFNVILSESHLFVKQKADNKAVDTSSISESTESLLGVLRELVDVPFQRLWPDDCPEETLLTAITNLIYSLWENPGFIRNKENHSNLMEIMTALINRFETLHISMIASMTNLLYTNEALSLQWASLLAGLSQNPLEVRFTQDVLREVCLVFREKSIRDANSQKNMSQFLIECSLRIPLAVLNGLTQLLPNINHESYTIRNSIIELIRNLIVYFHKNSVESAMTTRDSLLDLLQERVLDIHAFTRSHDLKMLESLFLDQILPLSRLLSVAALTADRLKDKSAFVRKSAIKFLISMIENNPFGGSLQLKPFETKALELSAELNDLQNIELTEEQQSRKKELEFCMQAVSFVRILVEIEPLISVLLESQTESDVLMICDLLKVFHIFSIYQAQDFLKKMLVYVFSENQKVSDKVVSVIMELYIYKPGTEVLQPAEKIAIHFIVLSYQMTIGELMALESVLLHLVDERKISQKVGDSLWHIVMEVNGTFDFKMKVQSLILLGILAKKKPKSICDTAQIQAFLSTYLDACDPVTEEAILLVREFSLLLSHTPEDLEYPPSLFEPLKRMYFAVLKSPSVNEEWYRAAEGILNSIVAVFPQPDYAFVEVLRELSGCLSRPSVPINELSHLLFCVGHIAMKLFIYSESLVNRLKKEREKTRSAERRSISNEDDILTVVNQADDEEERMITDIAETQLFQSNLLSKYLPLILHILRTPCGYPDNLLLRSCILSLSKCMAISETLCQEHIQLLFSLLASSQDGIVRSNIVIALGDLVFRHPNVLEGWTSKVYGGLKDSDDRVRKNTLMVVSHLILNDMIKVKGQISDAALLLVDKIPRIQSLAFLLFSELSKKGKNPIYNYLHDIVSRLTHDQVAPDVFKRILSHLVNFLKKDSQNEIIAEKFIQRMNATEDVNQWTALSYFLSLLSFNEKAFLRFMDLLPLYKHTLSIPDVYDNFQAIQAKIGKILKPESKDSFSTWVHNLEQIHEGQAVEINTSPIKKRRLRNTKEKESRTPRKSPARKRRKQTEKSDSEETEKADVASDTELEEIELEEIELEDVGSEED